MKSTKRLVAEVVNRFPKAQRRAIRFAVKITREDTLEEKRADLDGRKILKKLVHPRGWLVANQPTVRYKWNQRCPDCGQELEEIVEKGHPNSNRRIDIDCTHCSYCCTAYLTPKAKRYYMYGLYRGQRKPDVHVVSETVLLKQPKVGDRKTAFCIEVDRLTDMVYIGDDKDRGSGHAGWVCIHKEKHDNDDMQTDD